jgi:hypothetical protein
VYRRDQAGRPVSWAAEVPLDAIRWRRVEDGQVVKRQGHRKGRVFRPRDDELVVPEQETAV